MHNNTIDHDLRGIYEQAPAYIFDVVQNSKIPKIIRRNQRGI